MELKLTQEQQQAAQEELLIVPYGIETEEEDMLKADDRAFNRTLWN